MKTPASQKNSPTPRSPRRIRPENKDKLDPRGEEEYIVKGDDVTHPERPTKSKKGKATRTD